MISTFNAALYAKKNRDQIANYAVSDMDSPLHIWGQDEANLSFRRILMGTPESRGELWKAWIRNKEIETDESPAFYVLEQRHFVEGVQLERWAIYATLDVNDDKLFIHENVSEEGVERARQGTEACESDIAPIFVGCEEEVGDMLAPLLQQSFQSQLPLVEWSESRSSTHRVWRVTEKELEMRIKLLFTDRPLFLLDGHHRLQAAKANHRIGLGDGKILACICSMGPSDTLILPIHRVVNYDRWILFDHLLSDLVQANCKVKALPEVSAEGITEYLRRQKHMNQFCVMLHSHIPMPHLIEFPDYPLPSALSGLSVACLDFGVLANHKDCTAIPVPNFALALEQLAHEQAQVAFFLPAASSKQVRNIAQQHLMMPRKSTRFVPKPALGLITRPWT